MINIHPLDEYFNTCIYKMTKETLRSSSSEFFGVGTNLQNQPDNLRRIYVPTKGKKFLQCDQSGAEALIVAYLCKAGKFRELFINGIKPHVFVALHNFVSVWKIKCKDIDIDKFINTPIAQLKHVAGWKELDTLIKSSDSWAAHERYYFIAKQQCHSLNYNAGADAFRLNVLDKSRGAIVIDKHGGEQAVMGYHGLFPEIRSDFHRMVDRQLEETKVLYNLQGYPRQFTRILTESARKEAYAHIPQSTVGCITHIAITRMYDYICKEKRDWDILNNCHDSMLVQAPIDEELECAKKMKEFMEQELTSPRGEKFNMRSEVATGFNWSKWKEGKNEDGLREIKL